MINFRTRRIAHWFALAALIVFASLASAGPESEYYAQKPITAPPSSNGQSDWEVRIGIPGWVPTITGDFSIRGATSSVDLDVFDHLSSLDGLFMLSAYVRYQRWEVFGDGFYINVADEVSVPNLLSAQGDLSLKTGFAQVFLGYRVIDSPKGYLSLFAGARYNYMGGDLQIFDNGDPRFPNLRMQLGIPADGRVSGSRSWVDPVVGLAGKVHISKPVSLWAKADVGGFGLNSGTAYAISGGVEFQITHCVWLQTGWVYVKNDYSSGGFSNETELSGPLIQFGLNF
jgi:hypothetical protein